MVEHVVVGGGTSAVLLSRRLLDEGHKVILLEKGANRHKNTATPVQSAIQKLLNIYPPEDLWTFESRDGRFTKQVESFPQRLLNDRVITYSSASGIGGNSNVNAMICDIGSDNIYDNFWPPSWNSKRIHGYAKIVDKLIHQKEMRTSGNMKALMETIGSTPLQQIYLHYRATIDPNDCSKRWKLGNMLFDEDYESSGQLTIVYDFNVDHIEIENGCAVAVVDTNGQKYSPKNGGEIVIAAGVFESPKLLHRSGIDLSGLGKHLQDHVVVPYISVGNWRNNWNIFKMRPRKTHEYPLNGVHGWVFLDKQGNVLDKFSPQVPSCQLLFVDGFISAGTCDLLLPKYSANFWYCNIIRPILLVILKWILGFSLFQWLCGNVQGVLICLVQPRSVGTLELESNDIDPNYLGDPRDLSAITNAIIKTNQIFDNAKAYPSKLWHLNVLPGIFFNSRKSIENTIDYIRNFATTYYHPCGTCRMAINQHDRNAVVDEDLRVIGVNKLRVADASVICHIPNVPIAKLCMVIGVAAAERLTNEHKR